MREISKITDAENDSPAGVGSVQTRVYFVQWKGGGPLKIGVTKDIKKRLIELQNGSAIELRLVDTVPGDRDLEQRIHLELSRHRIRGEWYLPGGALVAQVRELVGDERILARLAVGKRQPGWLRLCESCGGQLADDNRQGGPHVHPVYAYRMAWKLVRRLEDLYGPAPEQLREELRREAAEQVGDA